MVNQERLPILTTFYADYLASEDSAAFIRRVSQSYTNGTLQRLATSSHIPSRRAAVLALSFLGEFEHHETLGRALNDTDRHVRQLAENGIRSVWRRVGSAQHRQLLGRVIRLNNGRQWQQAIELAGRLIRHLPRFAEAWNQRAVAYFHVGRYEDAAHDCHQALELNAYHFGAAIGMGQSYLELNEPKVALECFRRALRLHPDLEAVRAQIHYLEKSL